MNIIIRFLFACTVFVLFSFNTFSQTPKWNWAQSITGNYDKKAYCITSDSKANMYVAGEFTGDSLSFGLHTVYESTGTGAIFLAKFDSAGTVLWLKSFDGNKSEIPFSIATDKQNNLYMVGEFYSTTIDFGGKILTNAGNSDGFLVKFNEKGTSIWAKSIASASKETVSAVEIDQLGNVIIAGSFFGPSLKIDNKTLTNSFPGKDEIMVSKFNSSGMLTWLKSLSGAGDDVARDLAIDLSNNIVLVGHFKDNNLKVDNFTLNNKGDLDICIVKLDEAGAALWVNSVGGNKYETVHSVSINEKSNLVIGGGFSTARLTIGSTTLINNNINPYGDILIFEIKSNGVFGWAKSAGGGQGEGAFSVITDNKENSYVLGNFSSSSISFDNLKLTNNDPGFHDSFLVKLDKLGKAIWVKKIADTAKDGAFIFAWDMVMDKFGGIYTTGYYRPSQISFDSISTSKPELGNAVFVAKLENQDISIGVKENLGSDPREVKIYPNPFQNIITFSSSEVLVEITLYNSLGVVVYSSINNNGIENVISTSKWPTGVYYFVAKRDDGSLAKSKVVKQ